MTGVGYEVLEYQKQRIAPNQIAAKVIPNSFDVKSVPVRQIPEVHEKIKFLFLTGSPFPWVGIDLLLKSIVDFPQKKKIEIFIVGPIINEYLKFCVENNINDIVFFEGEKSGNDLDSYFSKCHIAFGTLAMQRVGLNEHSSLKVLEYASRGIPFVIAYQETNFFSVKEFSDFYLQLPYNGERIDLKKVLIFAKKIIKDKQHAEQMRILSLKHLDTSIKMSSLKEFLLELNENR